ncbi:MAG: endolytic transglycosylase MltG [Burkholderiales bacterium]|nr:endolytic transglycosylase MltG [Burkholderiales bacterium]
MSGLVRLIKAGILIGTLAIVALAGWLVYFAVTPVTVAEGGREILIQKGRSLNWISGELVRTGVLQEPWSFRVMGRLLGRAEGIQAGVYRLPERITPYRLLEMLANGEVIEAQITFIEGWTFSQMRLALAQHPLVTHEAVNLDDAEVLRRLGAKAPSPEGLFFPDTYFFSPGSSDWRILERAYSTMQSKLNALWSTRRPDLPYTSAYQALIMASIVEKETGLESERAMVAAVFVNRLKRGMRLQTDPTVIYGLGSGFDGNLRKRDLETDTPYNTYTRAGLPPTPISMPGQAALEAAMQPAASNALYFVARGDGSSHFSTSLQEHNAAVRRYQLGGR